MASPKTQELKADLKGNYTGNILQDALTDLYSGSNVSRDNAGNIKLDGMAWWLQPFAPNAKEVAETSLNLRDSKATDKAVARTRFTREELQGELNGTELTPDNVASAASRLVKGERDEEKKKLRQQTLDDRADERQYQTDTLTAQLASSDRRFLAQMESQAADRRLDRELQRDQQAYQNRVLDLKEARLARNDRQAAIQQMMAGLAQLGASIAI